MTGWTEFLMPHLMLAPIMLPMLTAALMLFMGEERQRLKLGMNILSTTLGLLLVIMLLGWTNQSGATATMAVYMPGNWPAPFGIALALDRLSALMLLVVYVVALAALVFSAARGHKAGVHFHPLFQLQLMGLSGAFLTADLFNLFVFFEIMLAASYGLLLHGSGRTRIQAGLHYIAINLVASSLFLIGVSMLYGITGTLNMADLARAIPLVHEADRGLLHAAVGVLGTAFLIKAAMWPLNFWLVPAYSAAIAPSAALFAVMTKVGVYVILRLWTLLFSSEAGESALFGGSWLIVGGMVTMVYGAIGMLGSQRLTHLAGFAAILSSGTLLAATGFGQNLLTAGLLYYLPGSTLAVAALFLIADVVDRWRVDEEAGEPYEDEEAPFLNAELLPTEGFNLDEDEELLIGRAVPAAAAFIGVSFMVCTLLISGLPPLSGFVGKFAMLTTLLNPLGLGTSNGIQAGWQGWAMVALLIITGLMALIALTRAGIRHFWANPEQSAPSLKVAEGLPIAALLLCCVALTVKADDVMRYTQRAANALHSPDVYVSTVMGQTPVPAPKEKKALDAESPEAAARAAAREMEDEPAPGITEPESANAESLPTVARKEGGQS
ncbi:MAG: monovalent cation/H+ antiporter subunit D [Comamonas sp.]|jgi:multicomponent K+:H+ antiporter subunit D|uniref:monovalent cation/H+ antiporter subunit D n=1 Tax=Comamonas sp. TaxID=34028 RepID=UPI002835A24D|nr:monovalent cation/H+ antiporter subunit D [Comamonas sp.]MDR0212954.1 monovalent cation/H+ antiporter subunit D [Comamonas sp.]